MREKKNPLHRKNVHIIGGAKEQELFVIIPISPDNSIRIAVNKPNVPELSLLSDNILESPAAQDWKITKKDNTASIIPVISLNVVQSFMFLW